MRNNRLSSASLLSIILAISTVAGQQLVFAQSKKPVSPLECDPSGPKTTPLRIPPASKPAPSRIPPAANSAPVRVPPASKPAPNRIRPNASSTPSRILTTPKSTIGSTPPSGPIWETIRPPSTPFYTPTPEIDWGQVLRATPNASLSSPSAEHRPAISSEVIDRVLGYSVNVARRRSTKTPGPIAAHGRLIRFIQLSGAKPRNYYSNKIYEPTSNVATSNGLAKMREANKRLLETLGPKLLGDPALRDARFITTQKSGSEELVTVFEVREGQFGAVVISLNAPAANCAIGGCTMANVFDDIIGPLLEPISGRGRLYMIGDELEQIDPAKLAQRFNCEVLRRSTRLQKSLTATESRLSQLTDRKLEAATTEFVNGLPRTEAEAVVTGYQRNEAKGLRHAATEADKLAKRFFKQQKRSPSGTQTLQELFIKGESDVVLIVAHSDKARIYINGTPISIDEIKNYPDRHLPNSRPRIGILLSCYGGDFRIQKGLLFWKHDVDSLAEVLVRKGYFDKVVAPPGEITPDQVTKILKDYFSGKLIRGIAANHQLLEIAEFRKRILPSEN